MSDNGTIEPNGDRILIRPMGLDRIDGGKLELPADRKPDALRQATVLKVGPGTVNHMGTAIPMATKDGDEILYDTRTGIELRVGNKSLLFLHDSQVVAYIRPRLCECGAVAVHEVREVDVVKDAKGDPVSVDTVAHRYLCDACIEAK